MPRPSPTAAPSKLASIQAFVSRAGFFWRGGAIGLGIVFGVSLVIAVVVGDVYESESIVEFADVAALPERANDPRAEPLDEELRGALSDPAVIEQLARELADKKEDGP